MSLADWFRSPTPDLTPPPTPAPALAPVSSSHAAAPAPVVEAERSHTQELSGPSHHPIDDGGPPAMISFRTLGVVEGLRGELERHTLWNCRLLRACDLGHLTLADWRYVFGQYQWYTASFTRYLAAVMAGCTDDYYRARLAQNLWEEGGMLRPEQRHAQIFREFLRKGLSLEPNASPAEPFTARFVDQYLDACRSGSPAFVSAFLALGTEALVAPLYMRLREGLRRAGVAEEQLQFFSLHIDCDDAHAATLVEMLQSYAGQSDWEAQARAGMLRALELRQQFFEALHEGLERQRLMPIVRRIQEKKPLGPTAVPNAEPADVSALLFPREAHGHMLYANKVERLNIEFAVERVPFTAEVLDPRLVHIPPGRCNERHKHAHESLFLVLCGQGRVRIGEQYLPVRPGDMVFVPRWVLHQTENQGEEEMVILALTDHGLTSKAFIGDYDRTARMKRPNT